MNDFPSKSKTKTGFSPSLSARLSFDSCPGNGGGGETDETGEKNVCFTYDVWYGGKTQRGKRMKESPAAFRRVRCGSGKGGNHTESRTHLLGPHEREAHTHTHTLCKNAHFTHPIPKRGCSYSPDWKSHTHSFLCIQSSTDLPSAHTKITHTLIPRSHNCIHTLTSGITMSRSHMSLCHWPVGFGHHG